MIDMSNTDTEYITVKRGPDGNVGIFVGGKITTEYRGEPIFDIDFVKDVFAWMQEQYPQIEEFHTGAFSGRGKYCLAGDPALISGPHAWCRVKLKNSSLTPWFFNSSFRSYDLCANVCASKCAYAFFVDLRFRSALISLIDNPKTTNNRLCEKCSVGIHVLDRALGTSCDSGLCVIPGFNVEPVSPEVICDLCRKQHAQNKR